MEEKEKEFEAVFKSASLEREGKKPIVFTPMGKDDVTVVIPTLNEEEAIGKVLEGLRLEGYLRVLVVDGYSTDGTVKVAESNGGRVIMQHGRGKTGALRTAVEHVDTPFFVVMDGDCTYDPRDIGKFLPHLGLYDEVIGARVNGRENLSKTHRFGNWMITKTFNFLFGTSLSDVCSGMYALRTDFARQLNFETGGFDVEVELAAQAAREAKITQVPIGYNKRVGRQKLCAWRHGLQILSTIWNLASSYNPIFLFSALAALAAIPAAIIFFSVAIAKYTLLGMWYSGWSLFGVMLILMAMQALTISTLAILLKRIEQRIVRKLRAS